MLIRNKTTLAIAFFSLLASISWAQIKIQPSAAKGGNCSGSITVDITGNAGQYVVTLVKKPENEPFATQEIRRGAYTFKDLCAGDYGIDVEIPMDYGRTCTLHYEASVASDCGNITLEGLEEAKHAPTDCQTKDGYLQFHRLAGPMGGNPPYQMNLYGPNGSLVPASAGGWQNLGVGNYELRVKDAQDCEAYFPFTLGSESDAELVAYLESVNVDLPCGGLSNGALELVFVPEGAQYTWSNGATTQRLSNLSAGDYTLTLTNGQCTASRTFELRDEVFPPLTAMADILPVCPGSTYQLGSIRLKVTGGSEPYQVKWSNGWSGTILNNLKEGTYTVTITDRCKSVKSESYQIVQAAAITIEETTMHTCPQSSTGSIQLNVSGGTAPYQYKWSTGAVANPLTGLNAGKYSVTVTDKGQCRAFKSYEIGSSNLSLKITDIKGCEGNNCANAKVDIAVQGGVAPYGYLWKGPNNFRSHNQNLRNINEPGVYTIVVTDAELCTYTKEVNIIGCANGENISVSSTVFPAGGLTPQGAILLNVTPSGVDYVYNWSGSNGFSSSQKDLNPAIGAGNYSVTVKGPCQNQNYQRTFEIRTCNLTLGVEDVESTCSNAGYGSATILLKNIAAEDRFLFNNSSGVVTEATRIGSDIKFVIERLKPGILEFKVLREGDNCSAEIKVSVAPSSVSPNVIRSYITGIDQETQLPKPFYCVTQTKCQSELVDYKIEPYSVKITGFKGNQCYGEGGCDPVHIDTYFGNVVDKISIKGNNCYRGLACEMVSWFINNFGYTVSLDGGVFLGPAEAKVEEVNGRCIYEVHCPNDGSNLPIQSIDIGKAEMKIPTNSCGLKIPQIRKEVCVKSMLLCDNKLVSYEIDESKQPRDCCVFALKEDEEVPHLASLPNFTINPKYLVDKKVDYHWIDTLSADPISATQMLKFGEFLENSVLNGNSSFKNEEIAVFPNPFDYSFSILLPNLEVGKEFLLSLYTLQGRLIHQLTTTNHEVTLDLPNLPQGAYFLKVSSKQGELWVKKLIKMP